MTNNDTNSDIHSETAEDRRLAKIINYGIIYGMGTARLADQLLRAKQMATPDYNSETYQRAINYAEESVQAQTGAQSAQEAVAILVIPIEVDRAKSKD